MTTSPTPYCPSPARTLRLALSVLCLSLAGSCPLAAEPAATPSANPPMAANQLVMTVLQSGVPQVASKGIPVRPKSARSPSTSAVSASATETSP